MSEKIAKSYLPKMKKCLLTFLRRRFDLQKTEQIYQRIEELDEKYRREEPYIGNKDNMMADNLYQSYCMFALYEAMDRQMTQEDIQELVDIYFEQSMAHMPKKLNLSILTRSRFLKGMLYKYMEHYAMRANAQKGKEWGNTWGIKVNPDKRETGIALNLVGCPLADFARKHDMMDILPIMCNIDHRSVETFGMKLYRDKTVSNGNAECAYWVVDSQSKEANLFVNEKNQDGLILSRMKSDI